MSHKRFPKSLRAWTANRRCTTLPLMLIGCASGCFRISIDPTCPETLMEGATGALDANQLTPGAIATYRWEADPAAAVAITGDFEPSTTFEALAQGPVTFTLTASDGLFQSIDSCTTLITAPPEPEPDVRVMLVANPTQLELAEDASTLLTCTSTGTTPAVTLTIDQLDGPLAELTAVAPGVSVAVFDAAGTVVFRCLGADADGNRGDPAVESVTVTEPARPGPR